MITIKVLAESLDNLQIKVSLIKILFWKKPFTQWSIVLDSNQSLQMETEIYNFINFKETGILS